MLTVSLQSTEYDPYDSSDLTPAQLAHFYRACNGNYDQLFLSTPPSTLAFIYKNLNCHHSLQPTRSLSKNQKYSDPTIPALKLEGWILWSTIQLLLAPDEHAEFLRQAVKRWDIKVPGTDDVFPKILPRSCFPQYPDPIMQNWYDGMTDHLRREMEEERTARIRGSDDRPDSPMPKHQRLHDTRHMLDSDDDTPLDPPKNSALAYFLNPTFRTGDGKSGVMRGTGKRPQVSPRHSFVQRGKTAAATVGRVVQNVASPHLWDGHPAKHHHESDHHRHKSLPDRHRYQDDENGGSSQNSPTGLHPRHHGSSHGRRGSHQPDVSSESSYWGDLGKDSPRRSHSQRSHAEPELHHRRSHESPLSSREHEYFPSPNSDDTHARRNSSAFLDAQRPKNRSPTQAPGFKPSISPLFATHVARGEATLHPYRSDSRPPLQRRADHRSPERVSTSRPGSARDEDGSDSALNSRQGQKAASRYGTPVPGMDGRRVPLATEVPYRGR